MVGGLGMRVPAQHQSHQCQAEFNHAAHGWPRSNTHEKSPTSYQIGRRTLVSNRYSGRVGFRGGACACAACPPPLGFVLPKIGSRLNWICRHNQESRESGVEEGQSTTSDHRKEAVEGWAFGASTGMRDLSTAWVRSAKSWILSSNYLSVAIGSREFRLLRRIATMKASRRR